MWLIWVLLGIVVIIIIFWPGPTMDWSTHVMSQECLAQIDVQLKRRYDLIPTLLKQLKVTRTLNVKRWKRSPKPAQQRKPPRRPAISPRVPPQKAN